MNSDESVKNKKNKLNVACLIVEEYFTYLFIKKENPSIPQFLVIELEYDLIQEIINNSNIKYDCKEDLKPLFINVLIKIVKQKLDEMVDAFDDMVITDPDFHISDYEMHLNEINKKLDFFCKLREDSIKNLTVAIDLIDIRIILLKWLKNKLKNKSWLRK